LLAKEVLQIVQWSFVVSDAVYMFRHPRVCGDPMFILAFHKCVNFS
jgi:hypothetical protein